MANQALIQGAYESANKFVDAGSTFGQRFENRMAKFSEAKKVADAKREEWNTAIADLEVDDMGNTVGLGASIGNLSNDLKLRAFEELGKGDPFNPKKAAILAKYKQEIGQIGKLAEIHKAALEDMKANGNLMSEANDPGTLDMLNSIKDATISRNEDGSYVFKAPDGTVLDAKTVANYNDNVIEKPTVVYEQIADTADKALTQAASFEAAAPRLKALIYSSLDSKDYSEDFLFDTLAGGNNIYDKMDGSPANWRIAKYHGKTKADIIAEKGKELGTTNEQEVYEALRQEVVGGYMDAFQDAFKKKEQAKELAARKANAGKVDKDAILNQNIAQDIQRWRTEAKFEGIPNISSKTIREIGSSNFINEMAKFRVKADPVYGKDKDGNLTSEIIGYDLYNPNLGKEFSQTVYTDYTLNAIDAVVENAIGANRYGVRNLISSNIVPPHKRK